MWGRGGKAMIASGSRAPAFELADLDGNKQSLSGILKNGPALLAFFKVSCPVCQLTAPYLERLAASSGIQVIGISQDDRSATAGFNQRFGVTFPVLLDSANEGYAVSNDYGISSVPSLFLVEPDGLVSKSFHGFSKRDLEDFGKRAGMALFRPEDNVPEWKAG
jgi:peroxiredoxin